ncbi:hypothetical protein OG338_12985 [Streptomyces sp. NBC_00726]|uniref:hypothetical protein n=1 Tax=Streptomyces sp. NBC_00726 TaxID=2903674 RepID=UPI00386DFA2A
MPDAVDQPSDVLRAYEALKDLARSTPRMQSEADGTIRLEVNVASVPADLWDDLLAVLDLGSTYGLASTPDGQTAWTHFDAPATA